MKTTPLARILTLVAATALSLPLLAAPPEGGQGAGRPGANMLQRIDTDNDGQVSRAEFDAAGDTAFARLDADGDGYVTAEEFDAAPRMGRTDPERGGKRDRQGMENGGRGMGQHHAGPRAEERRAHMQARMEARRTQRFASVDTDSDGIVSRTEFDAARAARFGKLDSNGDGVVDVEEMAQHHAERPHHGKRDR